MFCHMISQIIKNKTRIQESGVYFYGQLLIIVINSFVNKVTQKSISFPFTQFRIIRSFYFNYSNNNHEKWKT